MTINWYPPHMAKTISFLKKSFKHSSYFLQLVDARSCLSCLNNEINIPIQKHIIVITKIDLVSPEDLLAIKKFLLKKYTYVFTFTNKKVADTKKQLMRFFKNQNLKKLNLITVFGVPNVGKSTFINTIIQRKSNTSFNIPGVTKRMQVSKFNDTTFFCDTPGLLWPKFKAEKQAYNLALINSIKFSILPLESVMQYAFQFLLEWYQPELVTKFPWINDPQLLVKGDPKNPIIILKKLQKDFNFVKNVDKINLDHNFLVFLYNKICNNLWFKTCWDIDQIKIK